MLEHCQMETMKNGELSRTTIVMFLAVTEVLDGFLSTLYNILVGVTVLLTRYIMTL